VSDIKILVRQKGETDWAEYPNSMTHVRAVEEHAFLTEPLNTRFESKFSDCDSIYQHRCIYEGRYIVKPLRND